jgi:hypothetical protein
VGTIVFVHGTGVRLKGFSRSFADAKKIAAAAGVTEDFVECAWGDPLGVDFPTRSLPDPPTARKVPRKPTTSHSGAGFSTIRCSSSAS